MTTKLATFVSDSLCEFLAETSSSSSASVVGMYRVFDQHKISKSKLGSPLSNTKYILEIKQKAFVLLLIKRRTFFGR